MPLGSISNNSSSDQHSLTLDDGEAATIAYAAVNAATAIVDEKKANRIYTERFPVLPLGCTVDLLAHARVKDDLGDAMLANAVFNAINKRRMRACPIMLSG